LFRSPLSFFVLRFQFSSMRVSAFDIALLLMVVIWGANFSVIKYALREFPQISFNAMRLTLAAAVFLFAIGVRKSWRRADRPFLRDAPLTRSDWQRIALLGIIGHFLYQLAFVAGVARTSASNAALIFGATPVAVALLSSLAGHERVPAVRWAGFALSMAGIYVLVGRAATLSSTTFAGDVLVFCGMTCWSIYSVVAQPLLQRHSPLVVTGYSLAIGAMCYFLIAIPALVSTQWAGISLTSWILMALSSLLALALSYMIWYTAVQRIGSSRTAIYSNLTPIVAILVAAIWLGEPIAAPQIIGAMTILGGVFLTRLASAPAAAAPSES
jgi:drug/metabolite transporter (DMT)-like permease